MALFSKGEMRVLTLLKRGYSTGEIARDLYISVPTVRNHVQAMLGKSGTHSRLQLVVTAERYTPEFRMQEIAKRHGIRLAIVRAIIRDWE